MALSDTLGKVLLPIRAVQFLFTIIVLGLSGNIVNDAGGSASEVNFLLFTSIWSFLLLIYLIATQFFMQQLTHHYATLALESLTALFWFAGFIAQAVLVSGIYCHFSGCKEAKAAAVFGAFNWVLFTITAVIAGLSLGRNRGVAGTNGVRKNQATVDTTV